MPTISNPVLPRELLHWDETKYLHDMFNRYTELISQAYEENDSQESLKLWRQLFAAGQSKQGQGCCLVCSSHS